MDQYQGVNSEQYAILALQSLDEKLEDVKASRPDHADLVNKISQIKKSLSDLSSLRNAMEDLRKENTKLKDSVDELQEKLLKVNSGDTKI